MNVQNIFVGGILELTNAQRVAAIKPAGKGEKHSMALTKTGEYVTIRGQRINGIGIKRFVTEAGFVQAAEGDEYATRLADEIAIREGVKLVEHAAQEQASRLKKIFGGQACTFVPFELEAELEPVLVERPDSFTTTVLGLATGFSAAAVKTTYKPEQGYHKMDVDLSEGWLVGPGQDPQTMPRNTEYGGLVEKAVFVMVNSGIGTFVGHPNLEMVQNADVDEPFPRGRLTLALSESDDLLVVGIDGLDELCVQYVRKGEVIFERHGLCAIGKRLNLGAAIGSIAAALVHVANMQGTKKGSKKAA